MEIFVVTSGQHSDLSGLAAIVGASSQTTRMGEYVPLNGGGERLSENRPSAARVASLDVFRGLSIALMIFVDYASSILPYVAHAPWNGLRLADLVMPFFLFIAGISLALVYKRIPDKKEATYKATLKVAKLFLLGVILQGGYFHGVNSLTYGIDIQKIRWLGILQRIAVGYIVAALCEIWSSRDLSCTLLQKYSLPGFIAILLSCIYSALLHGLYVPDWQYEVQQQSLSIIPTTDKFVMVKVECSIRGDLGPGCNVAGMIDRYVLGINHLYMKPTYKNLKECRISSPSAWCGAPFDPEGILSSLMAAVTCLIGLGFGHVLAHVEGHKNRLRHWMSFSFLLFLLGLLLYFLGVPLNKSLYTSSYTFLTTAVAGITFCVLYLLVDICHYKKLFSLLEFMGTHSLSIFILVASNMAVIALQGFYWRNPNNNIVYWIISRVHK